MEVEEEEEHKAFQSPRRAKRDRVRSSLSSSGRRDCGRKLDKLKRLSSQAVRKAFQEEVRRRHLEDALRKREEDDPWRREEDERKEEDSKRDGEELRRQKGEERRKLEHTAAAAVAQAKDYHRLLLMEKTRNAELLQENEQLKAERVDVRTLKAENKELRRQRDELHQDRKELRRQFGEEQRSWEEDRSRLQSLLQFEVATVESIVARGCAAT